MRLLGWLRSFWGWLKANPLALAAAIGAAVGAWLVWRSNQNRVRSLEDALQVQVERRKIAAAEERARVLTQQADGQEEAVIEIKREIAESKRRVAEIEAGKLLHGKTDDEIADLFTKAGF
jgi:uncharacterized protein HemX